MGFIVFIMVFLTVFYWACPRVFLVADYIPTRRHLSTTIHGTSATEKHSTQPQKTRTTEFVNVGYPGCLDAMARATRSHTPTRDAVIESLQLLHPTIGITDVLQQLHDGHNISSVLENVSLQHAEEHRFFHLVSQSLVDGVLIPQSLEQAAALLREEHRHRQELESAAAQAQLSARLLTYLPFPVFLLLLTFSSSARHSILLAPSFVVIVLGIALNRAGWKWMRSLIRGTATRTNDALLHFVDSICVGLRAGIPLYQAVLRWASIHDGELHNALILGHSLSEAFDAFAVRIGGDATIVTHLLLSAERDGLPIAHTINQLSTEMRQQRRHRNEIALRQIPTKLALPVVLCVLPSFILLTVVPLIVANFAHFQFSPPPISTPL